MDGRFIDMINPMDVRESVQLEASDFEYRRIPTWMANATYFPGERIHCSSSTSRISSKNRLPIVGSRRFSRFITGRLIYTSYDGGGRNTSYGQYDKWDNIGWELSYEF